MPPRSKTITTTRSTRSSTRKSTRAKTSPNVDLGTVSLLDSDGSDSQSDHDTNEALSLSSKQTKPTKPSKLTSKAPKVNKSPKANKRVTKEISSHSDDDDEVIVDNADGIESDDGEDANINDKEESKPSNRKKSTKTNDTNDDNILNTSTPIKRQRTNRSNTNNNNKNNNNNQNRIVALNPNDPIDFTSSQPSQTQDDHHVDDNNKAQKTPPRDFKHLFKNLPPSSPSTETVAPPKRGRPSKNKTTTVLNKSTDATSSRSNPTTPPTQPLRNQSAIYQLSTAKQADELLSQFIPYNNTNKIPQPMMGNNQFYSLSELNSLFLILSGKLTLDTDDLYDFVDSTYRNSTQVGNNQDGKKNKNELKKTKLKTLLSTPSITLTSFDLQDEISSNGLKLYHQLVNIPPEKLFIDQVVLDQLMQGNSARFESILQDNSPLPITQATTPILSTHQEIPSNIRPYAPNLLKQADKYGDYDGFCGYVDFLNITRTVGSWIDLNYDLYQ